MNRWIEAARPRTLPLAIASILLGNFLAYSAGKFSFLTAILAILTTLLLQILSNFANDYGDGVKGTDNNKRIGPERAIQSGLISPQQMIYTIIINVLILILLITILLYFSFGTNEYLNLLAFFSLGIVSIFSAIKYTVGNKAYGYYALGDLFVLLFFYGCLISIKLVSLLVNISRRICWMSLFFCSFEFLSIFNHSHTCCFNCS